jgi:zinc transport system substrate-binding protein
MFKFLVLSLALVLIFISPTHHAAVPEVVVSIKPIHALVSGVMEGVGKPYLLLHGGESPHTYSLHPSQVRRLHRANLVVWVSPAIESFLEKSIRSLSHEKRILRLIDLSGLTLLKVREGKAWESHHHDEHHDSEFEIDPHIWLSPNNAKIIVLAIAKTLSQLDSNNAPRYKANASRFFKRIEQRDQALKQQLKPIKDLPFLVFHDAYQYFEEHYGLKAVGAITLSPETRPSVKRFYQLRRRLKQQDIYCIFSEPQFESALVTTLLEGTSIRRGVLDPLGANLASGTHSYLTLLDNLAKDLKDCLSH